VLLPQGVDVGERGLGLGEPPIPGFEDARDRLEVGPAVGGAEEVHELLPREGRELRDTRVGHDGLRRRAVRRRSLRRRYWICALGPWWVG
jgi:hypothetical protein